MSNKDIEFDSQWSESGGNENTGNENGRSPSLQMPPQPPTPREHEAQEGWCDPLLHRIDPSGHWIEYFGDKFNLVCEVMMG